MKRYFNGKDVIEVENYEDVPQEFRGISMMAGSWGNVFCKFEDMVSIPIHPNDRDAPTAKEALGFSDKDWDKLMADTPPITDFIDKAVAARDAKQE